jgi:uncharacterized protein
MHGLRFAKGVAFSATVLFACASVIEAQAASRGPSFGCKAAATSDELAICQSGELSDLDRQLARAFNQARSKLGARKARSFASRILRARHGCRSNTACIRRVQLEGLNSYRATGVVAAAVSDDKTTSAKKTPQQETRRPPVPTAKPGIVKLRCHMDSCGFAKLFSVSPVVRSERGTLMAVWASRVSIKAPTDSEGLPDHRAVRIPDRFPPPEAVDLVFCSAATPLVITQYGKAGGLEAFPLALGNAESTSGSTIGDQLYYWAVCHGKFLDESALFSAETNHDAKQLGYLDRKTQSIDADSISFTNLSELYSYLSLN